MESLYSGVRAPRDFGAELERIVSTPLKPENINSYGTDAIDEIADLSDHVRQSYDQQPTIYFESAGEHEDAAFGYHKLGSIALQLDHLAEKEEEIAKLDALIASINTSNAVLVPPDPTKAPIAPNSVEVVEPKKIIPRLKTLLFVLSNEFNLDIHDTEQVKLKKGVLDDNMMRETSYVMVDVPKLNKTILTCDEEDNATYVLNSNILDENGISGDDLLSLAKSDLNDFLSENKMLGRRIIYTDLYVSNMVQAIQTISEDEKPTLDNKGEYLRLPAPDGHLSMSQIAVLFGVSRRTITRTLKELGEELGPIDTYRHGNKPVNSHSPEQVSLMRAKLEEEGYFNKQAPPGFLSRNGLVERFGVASKGIEKVLKQYAEEIGPVEICKFGGRPLLSYSPEQVSFINTKLEENNYFAEQAPNDYLSVNGIAQMFGVAFKSVDIVLKQNREEIGPAETYMFGTRTAVGFSPDQISNIGVKLEEKGLFKGQAPDDYLSINGVAGFFGIDRSVLEKVLKQYAEEIGPVEKFRFYTSPSPGFSPEQVSIIGVKLEENDSFAEQHPEGYLSTSGVAASLGVAHKTIARILKIHGEKIGKVEKYRHGNKNVKSFSPEQISVIQQYLPKNIA